MLTEQQNEMIDRMLQTTVNGKLKWTEGAAEASYSAVLSGNYLAKIWEEPNLAKHLVIEREDGTVLMRFVEKATDAALGIFPLYDAAKDSALGVTKATLDILRTLRNL